jgi:GT2 family glycosyltransferase
MEPLNSSRRSGNLASLPSVSFVIPVRNPGQLLDTVLRSLDELDYEHSLLDAVIVDDYSATPVSISQGSTTIGMRVLRSPSNVGFYACANLGVARAEGDVIVFLSDDLFPEKNFLREALKAMTSDATIAGVRCYVFTDFSRFMPPLYSAPVGLHPPVYRKEAFRLAGGFDHHFRSRGDSDLELRILALGLKIVDCSDSKLYHPLRKLTAATLADYTSRHQYEALLLAKHPETPKRLLGGALTRPIYGSFSPVGIIVALGTALVALLAAFGVPPIQILLFLAIAYCGFHTITAVWLKASKRDRRIGLRDLVEYPPKSLIFVLALMLGRISGSIRYRKLVL